MREGVGNRQPFYSFSEHGLDQRYVLYSKDASFWFCWDGSVRQIQPYDLWAEGRRVEDGRSFCFCVAHSRPGPSSAGVVRKVGSFPLSHTPGSDIYSAQGWVLGGFHKSRIPIKTLRAIFIHILLLPLFDLHMITPSSYSSHACSREGSSTGQGSSWPVGGLLIL